MKRTTQRPRRVTMAELEALAHATHEPIEIDNEAGLAFLTLRDPKREYHARLDDAPVVKR